jgi:hypothetical protein
MTKYRHVDEIITPKLAREWLDNAAVNRSVKQRAVERIAHDIRLARWEPENGATIVFDQDNRLRDGQHRLLAIIAAGLPVKALVVRGSSQYAAIDLVIARNLADDLAMEGVRHATQIASIALWMCRYQTVSDTGRLLNPGTATKADAREMLDTHLEEVLRSLDVVGWSKELRSLLSLSMLNFVHLMGSRTSGEKADLFVEGIRDGADLATGSPIFLMRRQLIGQVSSTAKWPRERGLALLIKSWLAYEDDRVIKTLKWPAGEVFPLFKCSAMNDTQNGEGDN